jgi:hypothetical protein
LSQGSAIAAEAFMNHAGLHISRMEFDSAHTKKLLPHIFHSEPRGAHAGPIHASERSAADLDERK